MAALVGRSIQRGQVKHHPSPMSSWPPHTVARSQSQQSGRKRETSRCRLLDLLAHTCVMLALVGRSIRWGQVKHHPSPMSSWPPRTVARHEHECCSIQKKHVSILRLPRTQARHGGIGRTQHPRRAREAPSLTNVVMATTYCCT